MADIALKAAQIALTSPKDAEVDFVIAAETITAGQALFIDTNGKAQLADANASGEQQTRGLALEGAGSGSGLSVLKRGRVYGYTLTDQAYDAPIYQSDTVGVFADAAGTMTVPVGIVEGLSDDGNITKVFFFNPRRREDYS